MQQNRGIIIENPNFSVDMDKVLETKIKVVNTLVGGVAGLLRSYGVDVHKGIGTIILRIRMSWSMVLNCLKRRKSSLLVGPKVSKINVPGMESSLCHDQ